MIRFLLSTPQGDKNKLHITGPQNGGSTYLRFWSDVLVNRACPMASPAAPDRLHPAKLWRERTQQRTNENKENDQIIFVYPPGRQK